MIRKFLQKFFFVRLRLRGCIHLMKFRLNRSLWGGKLSMGRGNRFQVPIRCPAHRGTLEIGDHNTFGYWGSRRQGDGAIQLTALEPDAEIVIGRRNQFSNNVTISARTRIEIGDDLLCGDGVMITDADFHALSPELRHRSPGKTAPVRIGNNVWLGSAVMILKGVTIGDDAVIAPGSIVCHDVAPRTLAGGVPARHIKDI